jgi:5-methylcytosine-specific restriction protein B
MYCLMKQCKPPALAKNPTILLETNSKHYKNFKIALLPNLEPKNYFYHVALWDGCHNILVEINNVNFSNKNNKFKNDILENNVKEQFEVKEENRGKEVQILRVQNGEIDIDDDIITNITEQLQNLYENFNEDFVTFFKKIETTKPSNKNIDMDDDAKLKEAIELLKANHNLILTGAPGTGKTYLARRIAEQLIIKKTVEPLEILAAAIREYKTNENEKTKNALLLRQFYEKFPIDKIKDLTLEDYCTGTGNNDSFCYWIEHNLSPLGSYAPAQRGSLVYGIYYSKEKESYRKNGNIKNLSDEEAIKEITRLIHNAVNSSDEDAIKEVLNQKYFDNGFLLKILSTYKPNDYIPIHSHGHIKNCLNLFEINFEKKDSIFYNNKKLIEFYNEKFQDINLDFYDFMIILYDNFNIADGELKKGKGINLSGKIDFVQFHPSYDYTDFVEGLRPVKKGETIGFELKNGIFKKFCKKAKDNPNKNYVFIIDEINRAEISKVFGELFFSIDPGYRGGDGKVKTQFDNIQTEDTCFSNSNDDYFYVPKNVYILGTMNDIDRSVESFDFACQGNGLAVLELGFGCAQPPKP